MDAGNAHIPLRPVFIVGCPRSGTTLLQRMLNAHPDVAVAPETFFMPRFWHRRRAYGALTDDARFERLLRDMASELPLAEMGLAPDGFLADARNAPRTYAALMAALLCRYASATGASVVGEKTPDHLLFVRDLHAFFPRARFLHIVRDPRAVVASLQRVPWTKGSVERDAEVWRRKLAFVRRAAAGMEDALLTIHFEELIGRPEPTLRTVCSFLDLPFHPSMLAYHTQEATSVDAAREPWKRKALGPVEVEAVDRWRSRLSARDVAGIEAVVYSEMQRWGYAPDAPRRTWRSARHAAAQWLVRLRNAAVRARRHVAMLRGRAAGPTPFPPEQ